VRYARELVKLAKVSPQKFLGSKGPCIENALAEFGSAGLRLRGGLGILNLRSSFFNSHYMRLS
jgi:hypothetical protein